MDLQLKTTQSIRNSLTFWSSPALKQDENFNEACDFARWLGDKTGTVLKVVGCDIELEEPSTAVFCYTKPKISVCSFSSNFCTPRFLCRGVNV